MGTIPADTCVLGIERTEPLHVVVATDEVRQAAIVATAYVPDPELWGEGFRTRREP